MVVVEAVTAFNAPGFTRLEQSLPRTLNQLGVHPKHCQAGGGGGGVVLFGCFPS